MITHSIQIFYSLIILAYLIFVIRKIPEYLAEHSTKYKWIRKYYWNHIKYKLKQDTYKYDYKVTTYFTRYLNKSVGAKEYYINHGYDELKFIMIKKIEELQRFVEEYKFNTFGHLDQNESDFIDNYLKHHRNDTT